MIDTVTILLGLFGLALLGFGGDMLVRGAVGIAQALKVSPLFTGLVLVGFGTSTPELATSLDAALRGSPGIAIGNVVGSNIANILLILGLTAVLLPIPAEPKSFRRDAPMVAISTIACVAFSLTGHYERWTGLIFIGMLFAYLVYTYRAERVRQDDSAKLHVQEGTLREGRPPKPIWLSALLAAGGLGMVLVGADLLVNSSIEVAGVLGIPDTVIGLTVVAVGTSLPELATSIVAAVRRETDIALGNILGSNIFNVLGILGVTAVISPIAVPAAIVEFDVWILLGVTGLLLYFATTKARIERLEGAVFLALYVAYVGFTAVRATGGL